jgi:putative addiction module CopG family antidote
MTTLSVPISSELESFIESQIKSGESPNKAAVVRKALMRLAEEEAIRAVLMSEQEVREGKVLKGDLREILRGKK